MTSTRPSAAPTRAHLDRFLEVFEREHATTMRVFRAYPDEQGDFRPHERAKTARELAWIVVVEHALLTRAITTGFDWSAPQPSARAMPGSMLGVLSELSDTHARVVALLRALPDEKLATTVSFFVAPKTLGDIPLMDFLWFLLHDQIHHRGQFSVYLRMSGAKVPSIYGPTADEPWF